MHGDEPDVAAEGAPPARGSDPVRADLWSIPGVAPAGRSLRVDSDAVPRGPRRRLRPALVALVGLVLLPAAWAGRGGLAGSASAASDPARLEAAAHPVVRELPSGVSEARPPVFARVDGLALQLPGEVVLVGFHEAAYDDALELRPVGEVVANDNTTKFSAPPADGRGPGYVVLSSRARPNPAASAVDLVMRDDTPVRSLVTGTVTDVRPYQLYGQHPDHRIEIRPAARPDLRVVVIHVSDVAVAAGDHVEAGVTPLAAGPNRFPFPSHIDRYVDDGPWPHVHVEVKRGDA